MKLKELEALLIQHLQESGEIRTDIKWLKRAFWTLVSLVTTLSGAVMTYFIGHR